MVYPRAIRCILCVVAASTTAFAAKPLIDCSKKSLAEEVANAVSGDAIQFTGTCQGPIVVRTDGLALTGVGTAIIDGNGQDALTVSGAHGVSLTQFEVRDRKSVV